MYNFDIQISKLYLAQAITIKLVCIFRVYVELEKEALKEWFKIKWGLFLRKLLFCVCLYKKISLLQETLINGKSVNGRDLNNSLSPLNIDIHDSPFFVDLNWWMLSPLLRLQTHQTPFWTFWISKVTVALSSRRGFSMPVDLPPIPMKNS